ncbi:unnamed protein product [Adineta ricciae]|uniref:Helicase ATP-binding domain-containing protein n=1 Tax=Adineta ricciae TaxID=249248 RepID=A0A814N2F7_ADIRI|nr:unnamed protein product [Adineta ricciae]CAF1093167.1 unnamed protein product [Adineta ricciae]
MALNLEDMKRTSRFNTFSSRVLEELHHFIIYPHQRDALLALRTWYNNDCTRIGLVVIPTGGGKSGIAVLAPYVLNTTRVLVVTPSLQITNQLAADFGRQPTKSFYVKQGIVTGDAADMFVEPVRIVNEGRDLGDLAENLVIVNAHKFGTNSSVDWEKLNQKAFNLLIVDEAHHFPAPTWSKIVSHFKCKIVFLTATPFRGGQPILDNQDGRICFEISLNSLMNNGIIRRTQFLEIGNHVDSGVERMHLLSKEILRILDKHDQCDNVVQHQAMVLMKEKNDTTSFATQLNKISPNSAASYTGDTKNSNSVLQRFENGQLRVLVVCGKLLEGYDRKQVSLCVIARNVQPQSKVLFTQFVGRCLRKIRPDDPVDGTILTHVFYNQRQNYENLNEIAEEDPDDEQD